VSLLLPALEQIQKAQELLTKRRYLIGWWDVVFEKISNPYCTTSQKNGIILEELSKEQPGTVEKFCRELL